MDNAERRVEGEEGGDSGDLADGGKVSLISWMGWLENNADEVCIGESGAALEREMTMEFWKAVGYWITAMDWTYSLICL